MKCHNGNPYFIKLTYTNEIKENPTQYGVCVHHGLVAKPTGYTACSSLARRGHHPVQSTQLRHPGSMIVVRGM